MDNFFTQQQFDDYDLMRQEIRDWDLDFIQLDRGKLGVNLLQYKSSHGLFTGFRSTRSFEQHGSSPQGCWTFVILAGSSSSMIWQGREVSGNSVVIYRPGSEIDCISKPGFEIFTLSYSEKHLDDLGELLGLPSPRQMFKNNNIFSCDGFELGKIRLWIRLITKQISQMFSVGGPDSLLSDDLEGEIPKRILTLLARAHPVTKMVSCRKRGQIVRTVKEYFAATLPYNDLTIMQLCRITGVSERTLQYTFQEYYGVSPKNYLQALRINGVHRQLINADPSITKINDVANLWGFWHMGQFAADYRRLLGELPMETLKR